MGVEVRVQRSPWSVLACRAESAQETSAHASSSHWRLIIIEMFAAGKNPEDEDGGGITQMRRESSCWVRELYWHNSVET